jgi:uncharacterized heparinase superfamily protein
MADARTAARLWHTVRFLRATQVAARVRLRTGVLVRRARPDAARRFYEKRAARAGLVVPDTWRVLAGSAAAVRRDLDQDTLTAATRLASSTKAGSFRFLNTTAALGRPIDWTAPGQSKLWRYHLQYLDDLVSLSVVPEGSWPATASLMSEWIGANPLGGPTAGDAWHPYVVSVRLVNWMMAIAAGAPGPQEISREIRDSLAVQSLFITRNLEHDVGGNHLLKNLKALVVAGCFWDGPLADQWRGRYAAAFADALEHQLLDDGGHYERSPMYHAIVMDDLMEVIALLAHRDSGVPERLVALLKRMDAFLDLVTHPDGQIALFNDSAFNVASRPCELHACARQLLTGEGAGPLTLRQRLLTRGLALPLTASARGSGACAFHAGTSGYVTLASEDGRRFMIADTGAVCPDDLPAHAHADLLSYELSLDRERVIVDSGVSEYAAGPWRDHDRSTRAHNTVVVDGAEQSDCWASFRVAQRARPSDVRTIAESRIAGFSAAHDGYQRLREPVRHTRRIALVDDWFWLVVDDLAGRGTHGWESLIHLHPDAKVDLVGAASAAVSGQRSALRIAWFGDVTPALVRGATDPIQGWYAPEFGSRSPATTVVLQGRGSVPAQFGYVLVPQAAPAFEAVSVVGGHGAFHVMIGSREYAITLTAPAWRVSGPDPISDPGQVLLAVSN